MGQGRGARECLVHGDAVGGQVPEPGADDRPGGEGELHAFDVLSRNRLSDAQAVLRGAPRGHVGKEDRDPLFGRIATRAFRSRLGGITAISEGAPLRPIRPVSGG